MGTPPALLADGSHIIPHTQHSLCGVEDTGHWLWAQPEVPPSHVYSMHGTGNGARSLRTNALFAQKTAFALSHPLVHQVNNARAKTHT